MNKRLLPHSILPRQYGFLARHSAKSFVTYYTFDFGSAPFYQVLAVPHNLGYAPIHDMWVMIVDSISGDAVADYPSTPNNIYHTPLQKYSDARTLEETINCWTDNTTTYIGVGHISATSGTKHVYFHIKLYADDFIAQYFTPTTQSY